MPAGGPYEKIPAGVEWGRLLGYSGRQRLRILNLGASHGNEALEPLRWSSPMLWAGSFPNSGGDMRHRAKQSLRQVLSNGAHGSYTLACFKAVSPRFSTA
jgi:hypothetical protein